MASTEPTVKIGPYPSWSNQESIVAMDPWGHLVGTPSGPGTSEAKRGVAMQPTIAVSEATLKMPEVADAIKQGRLKPDGKILNADGVLKVVKCAIEPVWFLPGIAKRFKLEESVREM